MNVPCVEAVSIVAAQMNGMKLGLLSPLRFIQTCMEWQKCTFSTDNLHVNPSPADDPRFIRVLLQSNDKVCTNEN